MASKMRPFIEVKLPKSFSEGAQTLANIVVDATQQGITIGEPLGNIIALHLGVTAKELEEIDRYIAIKINEMLETFEHMVYERGPF